MTIDENGAWDSLHERKSELREVGLDELRVDMRFQREVNPHSLRRIKAEYHPQGIGQVLVAGVTPLRAGDPLLAVIDGQTRYRALRELHQEAPETPGLRNALLAEIFPELTVNEAALLFRLRNAQKPVPPRDRNKIAVIEGDPLMAKVIEQATQTGYVVYSDDPDNVPETLGGVPAVDVAKRIVAWGQKYDRPGLLAEALAIQAEAFRVPESQDLRGTVHPQILQATADLLRKNPNINEAELARAMRTQSDLLFDSERMAQKADKRMHAAVQIVLVERYNKGKRGEERIRS